jgi:hypothetical protein
MLCGPDKVERPPRRPLLTFALIEGLQWPRLQSGKPFPCSYCRIEIPPPGETFCLYCISAFQRERATPVEWIEREELFTCARCRTAVLGEGDHPRFCQSCLLAMLREYLSVQPSFKLKPAPVPERAPRRRKAEVHVCAGGCGKSVGYYALRCRSCSNREVRARRPGWYLRAGFPDVFFDDAETDREAIRDFLRERRAGAAQAR